MSPHVLPPILRRLARPATVALCVAVPRLAAAQHDHGATAAHDHAGKPVDCRSLAAPPWSGLPAKDLAAIRTLQSSLASVRSADGASTSGFAPAFGDIPTMGVHWINRDRMADGVRMDKPDHLLFTKIAGRDSLVGVAYAFRGPVDAEIPKTFASELAGWHDHPELGGGPGQTLHMLHVWFVPSPYGPFAGNNFFLAFMSAGIRHPDACWIQTTAEIDRLELVASLVDVVHRQRNPSVDGPGGAMVRRRLEGGLGAGLADIAAKVEPSLRALDAAAIRGDRTAWERAADEALATLRPVERRMLTLFRDRVKGVQSSMPDSRR